MARGGNAYDESIGVVCAALLYFMGIAADLLETAQCSQFTLYFGQPDYLFYDFLRAALMAVQTVAAGAGIAP